MLPLQERVTQLRAQFERCVSDLLSCAASAAAPGSRWSEALCAWTSARQVHLSTTGSAARPDAVRAVLLAVAQSYRPYVERLEAELAATPSSPEGLEDALWEFRMRRLDQLVDDELPKYIERIAPEPSLGSIFGQAAARSQQGDALAAAHESPLVQTIACRGCGAPRDAQNLYGRCSRCGTPFFEGP